MNIQRVTKKIYNTMKYNCLILIGLAFLLVGCIKDNPSRDCPPDKGNVNLHFVYYGDGEDDVFARKISHVDLFVYDETQQAVIEERCDQSSYNLNLPKGRYRIVCWGNVSDKTTIYTPQRTRTDFVKSYITTALHEKEGMDALYYAPRDISQSLYIEVGEEESNHNIEFRSGHIVLKAFFKGYRKGDSPHFIAKNISSEYDFDMNMGGEIINYKGRPAPVKVGEEELLMIEYRLPRLENENDVILVVADSGSGEEIYEMDFTDFLLENNIDITSNQEVEVELLFEFKSIGVVVKVPDWGNVPVVPF